MKELICFFIGAIIVAINGATVVIPKCEQQTAEYIVKHPESITVTYQRSYDKDSNLIKIDTIVEFKR